MTATLVAVVVVALFFDFTNGFHDTANSIATTVSTRAMSPRAAVAFAAVLNFAGAFVSLEVAATIAKGIVEQGVIVGSAGLHIVLAGLVGAITWNLVTWFFGLPSSSSHALIGGVMGSALAAHGFGVIQWGGIKEKVLIPSLVAPFLGVVLAFTIILVVTWLIARQAPSRVNWAFRRLQIVSGGFVAFTHGTNDAQKTMGIIALALIASGHLETGGDPPFWVIFSAALAMALGTYAGGWRIIKTLGQRVAKIDPPQGFAAQTSCAAILWGTAHWGFPVSTTHTISGSVLGAGAIRGFHAVRWGVAGNILLAWIFTLPMAGLVGAGMQQITRVDGGDVIVFVLAALIAAVAFAARRWETRRLVPAASAAGAATSTAPGTATS
ncbi:MAG: inorganic phosphate transporter [Actinobacteria bacterium]|nr:inorganic phosphate transporter [Actinomycetota bacterium]